MEVNTELAREYLRVSKDKSGRRRSVDEQHDDNQTAADERGWTLGDPYADNDKSASRYARKIREDFGKLVGDLETGKFGARYLILWEGSRGSREMEEWVRLIKLCERAGVQFYITSEDRILDPRNDHDWSALISMGQASEVESRKTSKRARRTTAANARAGRPHGICNDGYLRQYDPQTGDLVAQVIDPDRSMIFVALFDLLLQLVPLKEIARRFEAKGWLNKSGRPFQPEHLRALAKTHAYAGLRVHTQGREGSRRVLKPDLLVEATWPGIVSKEQFWKVQALLDAPERRTTRGGKATHLVSMIGRCGKCPAPIVAAKGRKPQSTPKYACRYGHVSVDRAEMDTYVTELVFAYLGRPDNYTALLPPQRTEELTKVRGRIAEVEHELQDLERSLKAREISPRLAGAAEQEWLTELEQLRKSEQGLRIPVVLQEFLRPDEDVRARWENPDTTIAAKREIVRMLFSPDVLGTLVLGPADYLRQPVHERVQFQKADDSQERVSR
ncbi:DNA invertase Pin-like site-specific DNA recombinase [Kribbella pratensis]|uniref:DNA invertase Pin-like site-specific DNA recombinase n=1 Tax=Kribbella pratensis TaxID=2512112 RepID=A0ABY2F9U9_9ACTN|nr:recombinase family protein [Kribbella pratensis]TDW87268.1 DNA invertase Pin-like site-specific DNA recombinase [Kribbella pratensis]